MLLRSSNAPIIFISPSSPPDTGQQRRDATHRDVREGFAGRRDFAATVSNPSGKKGNDLIHFRSEKKRHAVLAVTAVDLTRWWSIIDQAKPIADVSLGHGGGGAEGNQNSLAHWSFQLVRSLFGFFGSKWPIAAILLQMLEMDPWPVLALSGGCDDDNLVQARQLRPEWIKVCESVMNRVSVSGKKS